MPVRARSGADGRGEEKDEDKNEDQDAGDQACRKEDGQPRQPEGARLIAGHGRQLSIAPDSEQEGDGRILSGAPMVSSPGFHGCFSGRVAYDARNPFSSSET